MNYFKKGMHVGLALLLGGSHVIGAGATPESGSTNETSLADRTLAEKVEKGSLNLTLDQAVALALKQNPQVLEAIQLIEQTKGQIITVRAEALPNVTLSTAYTQTDPNLIRSGGSSQSSSSGTSSFISQSQNSGAQDKTWNVTVQATQLIYSGGQVGAAIKVAKLTLDSNYFNLRDVVDQTIANVRTQFYDVLLNRELIRVQEESVELLRSQLKDQQNRFEAGTVPRFNVLQAEVALANQLPPLIKARNNYLISTLTLARTLGIEYSSSRAGQPPLNAIGNLDVHERKINEPEAIRLAKEFRSFLKVQRQTILIQLQQIKIALAGYQPTLSVSGGYEVRNSPFSSQLDDIVNGWFFGVNGSWAIFDGGATYGRVKTAKAQLETAKVNYDDAVLQVELQVQQAIANLKQASETIQSQVKGVQEAQESLRLSQERLAAGAGVQLDVLNAQVALLTAQSNELQAQHDYNVALAQFEYAIGATTKYNDSFDDPLSHKKSYIVKTKTPPPTSAKD